MRFVIVATLGIALFSAPVQAAPDAPGEVRQGAFVGVRLIQPLGGYARKPARAIVALAPTLSARAANGHLRATRIGEGIALNIASKKPALTIAGMRADRVLHFAEQGRADAGHKQNLSTGTAVAIGVGVAVVAGVLLYVSYCDDKISSVCGNSDE